MDSIRRTMIVDDLGPFENSDQNEYQILVWDEDGNEILLSFNTHTALELREKVMDGLKNYIIDMEAARRDYFAGDLRNQTDYDLDPRDEELYFDGYDLDDPKSPDFFDRMSAIEL